MALPVPTKTWQFSVNQSVTPGVDTLTTNRSVLLRIKNILKGFALNPWTVQGSSNSSTAGMDGVDRWTSGSSLVTAAGSGAHSWIVLRQTGIATNYELLLDLNYNSVNLAGLVRIVSPSAGFTGGSINARPTATDERVLPATDVGFGASASNTNTSSYFIHAMQSTDGQATYLFLVRTANAGVTMMMGFGRILNPVSGLSNPSYGFFECAQSISNANTPNVADSSFMSSALTVGPGMTMYFTTEKSDSTMFVDTVTVPNSFSGEYPLFPIGLASLTPDRKGRHGQLPDMWAGLSSLTTGDTYPNDTSRQFAHFGLFVVPWDGSVVST